MTFTKINQLNYKSIEIELNNENVSRERQNTQLTIEKILVFTLKMFFIRVHFIVFVYYN